MGGDKKNRYLPGSSRLLAASSIISFRGIFIIKVLFGQSQSPSPGSAFFSCPSQRQSENQAGCTGCGAGTGPELVTCSSPAKAEREKFI